MAIVKKRRNAHPQRFKDSTPLERIYERFAAIENGLKCESYTPVVKTEQIYPVAPVPTRAIEVGCLVAMYCNPRLAGRVVAIDGDMLQVERGSEVVEIEAARCKALIPLGAAIDEVAK